MEQIFDIIKELHAAGTTILLVEQNAQAALSVGRKIRRPSGTCASPRSTTLWAAVPLRS